MTLAATERVVIVGAGAGGLLAAVFLARAGRQVLVVDRDAARPPGVGEPRPGVPQARHSHAYLARFRALLRQRAPDLLAALLAAGAREISLPRTAPAEIRSSLTGPGAGTTVPGLPTESGELVVLGARRALLDDVLRTAAQAEPGVTIQDRSRVTGLVTAPSAADGVPWVRGVRLADGTSVAADLVVDAGGRRSPLRDLLAAAGAALPAALEAPCGITYYSRFYARGGDRSLATGLNRGHTAGGSFDLYSCLVFPADKDVFSVTFGVLPEDAELRVLRHGVAFDAAVRAIGPIAPWLDGKTAVNPTEPAAEARTPAGGSWATPGGGPVGPLGPVAAMAGLHNRFHPWVADGQPAVLGLLPIGDAALITNPAHTRGTTLAALTAAWLTDVVASTRDPVERALRLDAIVRAEALPWYHDSRAQDSARLARWRSSPAVAPAPRSPDGAGSGRAGSEPVTNGEAFLAAARDPVVWQAFTRLQNLLALPSEVLADPGIVARVRAVQASGWRPAPAAGPSHADLVATAEAALARAGERQAPDSSR
ncbi:FAD-dependent monooxygenase [Pseudofrankia sp. DC12]|uniref:FAD-dependent monooxygenase n=1 Tax=Pseudofrankia sp. DC12 TaxID=683315 RepID=UPI001E3F08A6|nr:FAD-dependent monooxygenase [Pseudofrankia sp. DC12]